MTETNVQPHHKAEADDRTFFGFWIYLMTDLVMFAGLFAAYAVLHQNNFGGPTTHELYDLPFALAETIILLTSSFTCGLAMLAANTHVKKGGHHAEQAAKNHVLLWLSITFALGLSFLGLELTEFTKLVDEGNTWQRSAFLSSFFTLVGTHGMHITVGLLWMGICMIAIWTKGLTHGITRKLTLFSLFWHFLDIVWIFIFTIVYLMGKI